MPYDPQEVRIRCEILNSCWNGDLETVKRLVTPNNVNSIRQESFKNNTLLHTASGCGHAHVAQLLLKRGAYVNAKTDNRDTPLHVAAVNARNEVVKCLLKCKANVHAKNDVGWTPLHCASFHGRSEIVEMLLAHEAKVNAVDKKNNTALHEAAREGRTNICQVLLKHGANPSMKNADGKRPLDVCHSFAKQLMEVSTAVAEAAHSTSASFSHPAVSSEDNSSKANPAASSSDAVVATDSANLHKQTSKLASVRSFFKSSKSRMEKRHLDCLMLNCSFLTSEVPMESLCYNLLEIQVIKEEQCKNILANQAEKQIFELIQVLKRSGPHAWEELLSSLNDINQGTASWRLQETEKILVENPKIKTVDIEEYFQIHQPPSYCREVSQSGSYSDSSPESDDEVDTGVQQIKSEITALKQDTRKDSKTMTVTTPELVEKKMKERVKEYLPMGGKREDMISTNYEKLVNSLIPQGSPLLPKLVTAEVISIRAKNDVEGVGAAEKTPEKKAEMLIGIIRTLDQEKYFRFLAILATINEDQVQWLTEGKWSSTN